MIHRIWRFLTGQTRTSVITTPKLEKPAKIPAADIEQKVAKARARLAAKQAQKTATTHVSASTRAMPSKVAERLAKAVRVMRVKPLTGGEYYVLAVDLAAAKANRAATVTLCDPTGTPIPTNDPTRRSSLPLAVVLRGVVEPVVVSTQRSKTIGRSTPASTYLPAGTLSQEQQELQDESEDVPGHNTTL